MTEHTYHLYDYGAAGDDSPGRGRRPAVDAARLWSGGLAAAAIAALTGLVGVLVARVLFQVTGLARQQAFDYSNTLWLCIVAAAAALAATGVVHLLLLTTPRPLVYFGWIVGLLTAVAAVVPLLGAGPLVTLMSLAVVHLVIGLAVGSLVTNAAAGATRR